MYKNISASIYDIKIEALISIWRLERHVNLLSLPYKLTFDFRKCIEREEEGDV